MANRFIKGNNYKLYVLGFTNPVEGEIKDIEVSAEDGTVMLVIEETSGEMINILVSAITGVSLLPKEKNEAA